MTSPEKCAACGEPVVPGAAFCRFCGARHEQPACGSCGAGLPSGAVFCRSCGAPVGAVPPAGPTEPRAPVPAPPAPSPGDPPRSWRTPLLVAGAILLLGAGAAVAIVFAGSGGGSSTTVSETVAGEGAGAAETVAGQESGEAEPVEGASGETEANGLPPVTRGEMEEEIQALLIGYHEDVVNSDFRSAWALLSSRKRRQDLAEYGYPAWKRAQATLSGYLSPGGLEARVDGVEGEGVVRVEVTGMGWSQPSSPCSEWSGLTWVRYERGAWTYDPGYSTTAARRRSWQPRAAALLGAGC